jgi:hypothetical protein
MKPERWRQLNFILGMAMLLASMFAMRYVAKLLIWLG